ncbi:MAG: DUF6443 domain-containing protein, partial [Bacteroidota bacterium]
MKKLYLLFFLVGLLSLSTAQTVIPPDGIKVDQNGRNLYPQYSAEAPPTNLNEKSAGDDLYIFPCCTDTQEFYLAIELSYQDAVFSTPTTDWHLDFDFDLYINGSLLWNETHRLVLDMADQKVTTLLFEQQSTTIDAANSYLKVIAINQSGDVPLENVSVKARLYEVRDQLTSASRPLSPTVTLDAYNTMISWTDEITEGEIVDGYELEWLFLEEGQSAASCEDAFDLKAGTRIETKATSYTLDQLFPPGSLYFRVRRIGGFLPIQSADQVQERQQKLNHVLYGDWNCLQSAVAGFSTNESSNWQQTVTYAEDAKSKKVLSFYDGTLRPVQTLTNLNTENKTLIAEPAYDYEGRKVVDFLPFATDGWSPVELRRNNFSRKATYDNNASVNLERSTYPANDYYENHPDPYVPRANGYAYSQMQYHNDGQGRLIRQSGVGEKFRLEGNQTTGGKSIRYYYGTASQSELVRLFGTSNVNTSEASQYRKNLILDPNGQVSVTYLDPQGRTIATALAGNVPANLKELPSAAALSGDELEFVLTGGSGVTHHTILNASPEWYTFDYGYALAGSQSTIGGVEVCTSCTYDISIQLIAPNNSVETIVSETGLSATSCEVQDEIPASQQTSVRVFLEEIGEYTLIKEVTPHLLDYGEVRTHVESLSSTQEKISDIVDEIQVDETLCSITVTDGNDPQVFERVITQSCSAIREEIIFDLIADYNLTRDEAEHHFASRFVHVLNHERFCEYEFCLENIDSDVFDAKLFTINEIDEIEEVRELGLGTAEGLMDADPFFKDGLGSHPSDRNDMRWELDNFELRFNVQNPPDPCFPLDDSYTGPIDELAAYGGSTPLRFFNSCDGRIYHILYYEAEVAANWSLSSDEVEEIRWRYLRAFYLQAKNRIKMKFAFGCTSLREKFNKIDLNSGVLDGQFSFIQDEGVDFRDNKITEEILDRIFHELVPCTVEADVEAEIKGLLSDYYEEREFHVNYFIPRAHWQVAPLSQISELTSCLDLEGWVYDMNSSCGGCNPFFYDINTYISQYEILCLQNQDEIRLDKIRILTEEYIEEQITRIYESYQCAATFKESFSYSYTPNEYHYTLYYYDRADNLVKTVPPEGVRDLSSGAAHELQTTYVYNSLNQLIEQSTPDAGITRFGYDKKGQLRISQNAKQAAHVPSQFSYTKYDNQGRIVEVGEFSENTTIEQIATTENLADPTFPQASLFTLEEVTKTFYDACAYEDCEVPEANTNFLQAHLRGRVSYVTLEETFRVPTVTTYYSYDAHGNVKSLLQHIHEGSLGPKQVDYAYDLISGNVNYVIYQYGQPDQFYHHYAYDADNRIIHVETSVDGVIWNSEARYFYHDHGPLRRVELGEGQNLQGLDYYYTLQGWLKGVNGFINDDPNADESANFGKDLVSFNLGYFEEDFVPRADVAPVVASREENIWTRYRENITSTQGLYNGNIAWMNTWLRGVGAQQGSPEQGMQAMLYGYDQLNRITDAKGLTEYNSTDGYAAKAGPNYDSDYSYDANGNLLTLKRQDASGRIIDQLTYTYEANSNRLSSVDGEDHEASYIGGSIPSNGDIYPVVVVGSSAIPRDATVEATEEIILEPGFASNGKALSFSITDEPPTRSFDVGAFVYDEIGNLIDDQAQNTTLDWTVYGKVDRVTHDGAEVTDYTYDPAGNRVSKQQTDPSGSTQTFYIRDASGNILAVYDGSGAVKEMPIYGSSRLGNYIGGTDIGELKLGKRRYEISNHLGNVLTTFTDELNVDEQGNRKIMVASTSDYYPFGMQMPSRSITTADYRYGFNGKPKDDAGEFGSTVYDYGFRIYNPQI